MYGYSVHKYMLASVAYPNPEQDSCPAKSRVTDYPRHETIFVNNSIQTKSLTILTRGMQIRRMEKFIRTHPIILVHASHEYNERRTGRHGAMGIRMWGLRTRQKEDLNIGNLTRQYPRFLSMM